LSVEEIVEQVLAVEREAGRAGPGGSGIDVTSTIQDGSANSQYSTPDLSRRSLVSNLVIMGMGEPLANYDNLMLALKILNAPWGGAIGARKITISTSGLAPQIRKLADEPVQFRLAISLHGATDETRDKIMPSTASIHCAS